MTERARLMGKLTPRMLAQSRVIAKGNRNRDVAEALSISEDTVKVHVKHVMEKLGATDRTDAVVLLPGQASRSVHSPRS